MNKYLTVYLLKDKVGILQYLPNGKLEFTYDSVWINSKGARPISDVRLSLAGAQNKMAVRLIGDEFSLPRDVTEPTTHIIKPAIADLENSITNEFFCMRLAQSVMGKARVPTVDWRIADGVPFLLIERYDRKLEDNKVTRIHQEDFCQALSVGNYERLAIA